MNRYVFGAFLIAGLLCLVGAHAARTGTSSPPHG
jgi:hypothetical protein